MLHLKQVFRPRIYFAGKITPNCWRHDLVPSLRGSSWSDAPLDCGSFSYVGPIFISCDHRCGHGGGTHGAGGGGCLEGDAPTKAAIFNWNNEAIESADALIAYIDAYDCIGTVWEISFAQDRGIPTYLVFAPWIDVDEFWVPRMRAKRLSAALTTATVERLPAVVSAIVSLIGRRGGR
jgi:hypothetical protein